MAETCERGVIMYAGEVVEAGTATDIFRGAAHPYTKQLIKAFPNIHEKREMVSSIPGDPPNLLDPPPGCGFAPRCALAEEQCTAEPPALVEIAPGHTVRCRRLGEGV